MARLPTPKNQIPAIQSLRALAAGMVLLYHACYAATALGGYQLSTSNAGAAGVDVFFILSGFIITFITRSGGAQPLDFLARRLIRIAPLYWFYTLITVAVLVVVPSAFANLKFDPWYLLTSWFFLLAKNNGNTVGTVLGVGWTICYEFYFYLLFTLCLNLPRRWFSPTLWGLLLLGAALQWQVTPPAFASVAISALPLEFLAGCLLAQAYAKSWRLPSWLALVALGTGAAVITLAGSRQWVAQQQDSWRVVYFGLPALLLVMGVLSLEGRGWLRSPAWLIAIGDASYSLYLSHLFVLVVVAKIWHLAGLHSIFPAAIFVMLAMAVAVSAALLAFRWMEAPMTRMLITQWQRRYGTRLS